MDKSFLAHPAVAVTTTAILFLANLAAHAGAINWTNLSSGGWNTAANWSPNVVPGAGDTAIITNAGVTVSLNATTTIGGIILGTNGTGTVTLSLAGQTLMLNGPLTVNSNGSFTVDSGALVGSTNAVLHGTIGWSGASSLGGILTLASGSTLNLTTVNNHDLPDCTLTNNGMVIWNNGSIRGGGNSGAFIYNSGLWNAQSDQLMNNAFGSASTVFYNAGTFRKSGGAGGSTAFQGGVVFINNGKLDCQTNLISLQGGGSFTGGTVTNLSGVVSLDSGAFNLNGTVTSTNLQLSGGTLAGNNIITGGLNWIQGDWNSAASVTIAASSTLLITSGNDHNISECIVTNNGTVAWNNGNIRGGGTSGTIISNYGLWDAQSDQQLRDDYGGNGTVFNNYGTFRKSGGTGAFSTNTLIAGGALFNQLAGVIDVQNGTNGLELAFQGGGNFTGGYITTNQFGFTVLAGGGFNLNGTATVTNTWENSGNLIDTNVIRGALTWVSGLWNGATVTIASNCTVIAAGNAGNNDMNAALVTNYGTLAWSSGTIRGGNGTAIYNYGLWNAQSDQPMNNAYGGDDIVFNNVGTFRKTGTSGGSSQIQTGVTFLNPGIVAAQLGNISLQGAYSLAGGTLNTSINSLTNYGTITLAGTAPLTGTISASLNNGFSPATGSSFSILNYAAETGNFNGTILPPGFLWATNYGSTSYTITVTGILIGSITNLAARWQAGQEWLQFSGTAGASYTILTSTNLALSKTNWNALGTASSLGGGLFQFIDSPAPGSPPRFYRVRSP